MSYFMEVKRILDRGGIRYSENFYDDVEVLSFIECLPAGECVNLLLLFGKAKIEMIIPDIARISEYKQEKTLKLLNELNREHSMPKFCMDENGSVRGQIIHILQGDEEAVAETICEITAQFVRLINDEVYPKIKKIQWS